MKYIPFLKAKTGILFQMQPFVFMRVWSVIAGNSNFNVLVSKRFLYRFVLKIDIRSRDPFQLEPFMYGKPRH